MTKLATPRRREKNDAAAATTTTAAAQCHQDNRRHGRGCLGERLCDSRTATAGVTSAHTR